MLRPLFATILSLALAAPVFAGVRVVVTDRSGAPVAGAAINVIAGGAVRPFTTGKDGSVMTEATVGDTILVTRDGFASSQEIVVEAASEIRFRLEPASFAEELTVTASQSRIPMAEVSSSVSVIEGELLRETLAMSGNLADALGKVVPGLAPGTGSASIWGQTLRGRGVQVLVDGIPLTTLRNTARDLVAVDPNLVERVEVLRGTTAMYGDGATGGLINIVTRTAAPGETQFETTAMSDVSTSDISESAGGRLSQSASGRIGALDWRADVGFEKTGLQFDAEGDLIQPDPYGQGGLADSETLSLLGKLGWQITADSRVQLSFTGLDSEQDTTWTTDPSVNSAPALSLKSRAIRGLSMDHPQGSDNELLQLSYEDRSFLGATVRAQFYTRDYQTVFTPFDGRSLAIYGRQIFQSRLESESAGARLDIESTLPVEGLRVFWGLDAGSEETAQPVWIIDPVAYDQSGGRTFRTLEDRAWVPLVDKQNQAAFAQAEWLPSSRWILRGGLRHERVDAAIPTFTTLAGSMIEGGDRDWSDTLFNAGVVYYATPATRIWTSFSQGFSLPDIGLVLRSAPAGSSLDTLPFQPQVVDAWELGIGSERPRWNWSVATYYNTSDFGTSSAGFNQPVVRAPERIYGAELTGELRATARLRTGMSAAWSEGEYDPDGDGDYAYLNNYRIAAPSVGLWLDHATSAAWSNRAQMLWSGDRDRFGSSTAFGQRPIESYTVVDLLTAYATAVGTFELGVQNVLDAEYYVRDAQLLRSGRNDSHTMAPGRTLRLQWSIRY